MMLENICAMPAGAEASGISLKIKPRSWSRVWAIRKEHPLVHYIWLRIIGTHSCAVDMVGEEKEEVHLFMTRGLIGVIRFGCSGDDTTRTTVTAPKTSRHSLNVGKFCWSWILKDCTKVQEKTEKKVAVLCSRPRQTWNEALSCCSRATTAKKWTKNESLMNVQSWCFANLNQLPFCRVRCRRRRVFALRQLHPWFWGGGWRFAVPFYLVQDCSLKGMSEKACDCKVDNIWMCVHFDFPSPFCTFSFFDTALTRKTSSYENPIVKLLFSLFLRRTQALSLFEQYAWDTSDFAVKEVTRYQSDPGQATAYMLGRLALIELRNKTKNALKDKFSLQDFHYQVLSQGSAPLSFLQSHIDRYIKCMTGVLGKEQCSYVLEPIKSAKTARAQSSTRKMPPKPPRVHYIWERF